jgi:hypothetical protein
MAKQTDKQHPRAFGLEPVLEPGQGKQDYLKLRALWYKKAQDSGLVDIESFHSFSTCQVSSFLRNSNDSAAKNPNNYNILHYYEYLQQFESAIYWLKSQPSLCRSYKIHRFFAHKPTISLELRDRRSTKTQQIQAITADIAAEAAQSDHTSADLGSSNSRTYNVNYNLNLYILQALLSGISLRSLLAYLSKQKLPKSAKELAAISELSIDVRLQQACQHLKLGMLHQRVRLIHECCFQYLVATDLASLDELQHLELLGLDNPIIQLDWQMDHNTELKFRSTVDKYGHAIY